ncbi:MAG: fumarylacetoacetate hydrolase family protein [Deltaproteobacteria bacterium]|jgi:2-keto-4-pentenoate hydratase|nr:fumarylacetoacetate hydrolase family protein [Deltaproteobacteria bacterium]
MEKNTVEALATTLRNAELTRISIAPLTTTHHDITVADAYAVQHAWVKARLADGGKIIGKKVGLTSKAMQEFVGVNEPDFGHLFADMLLDEETAVPVSRFLQPKIEAELAFVMGEDIMGPGATFVDVLRSTSAIVPSFEIVDSRVTNWKIKIQDTIADNGSSAGLVLGAKLIPVDAVNLKYVGLVLEKNGAIIDTAAGAAILGHPAQSVAWLVNALGSMGIGLRKGEIVLSGSFTKAYAIQSGDFFSANFGGIGAVKIRFC